MEEASRTFATEMEAILEQCRKIREDILKRQTEQDRLFDAFDKHIMPRLKAAGS